MDLQTVYTNSSDFYHLAKFGLCFAAALVAASLSACGISTPGGYVFGTTSYLEEFNRGHSAEVTPAERQQLSRLVEEVK